MSIRIILLPAFLLTVIIGILPITGCESTTETNVNVLVRTGRTAYKMGDSIRVEVTSVSGSGIYYLCKGQIRIQQLDGDQVRNSWDVYGFELCDRKTEILLGETAVFTILPQDLDSLFADTRFDPSAQYQIQCDLYSDPECTLLLASEDDRHSNKISLTK